MKRGYIFSIIFALFTMSAIAADTLTLAQSPADPRCIVLSWNPNSEADLAGYKVYTGKVAGVYGSPVSLTLADAKHPTPTWTSPPLAQLPRFFDHNPLLMRTSDSR